MADGLQQGTPHFHTGSPDRVTPRLYNKDVQHKEQSWIKQNILQEAGCSVTFTLDMESQPAMKVVCQNAGLTVMGLSTDSDST